MLKIIISREKFSPLIKTKAYIILLLYHTVVLYYRDPSLFLIIIYLSFHAAFRRGCVAKWRENMSRLGEMASAVSTNTNVGR